MPGTVFGQDLSDANLFRRVRRGDTRSFGVLIHRHDATLRRLASRLLAEPDQVDPVLQKAYTKIWRTAAMARLASGRDVVRNWLYRVVYNTCVDELRRQPPHPGPPPFTGPRIRLPNTSVERRLSALRALNPGERIPLVLVDSEGFDVRAAARILQRKPSEVAADLATARRHWRDLVIGPPDAAKQESAEDQEARAQGSSEAAKEGSTPEEAESAGAAESTDSTAPDATKRESTPLDESGESQTEEPTTVRIGSGNGAKPPEATKPPGVVHAMEGAFDSERFTRLKRWFRSKSTDDADLDPSTAGEPEEDTVADQEELATDEPDESASGQKATAAEADDGEAAPAGKAQETASADQGASS